MSSVSGSTSAKRGSAPTYSTALAVAANVTGVVIASSPRPRPAEAVAPCRAAVPELNAIACLAPVTAASSRSNCGTRGPVVNQSERRAASTAATSRSSIVWCA
jgi:hypothetical protein